MSGAGNATAPPRAATVAAKRPSTPSGGPSPPAAPRDRCFTTAVRHRVEAALCCAAVSGVKT